MELPELPEDLENLPHMAWLRAKMLRLYRGSRLTAVDSQNRQIPGMR